MSYLARSQSRLLVALAFLGLPLLAQAQAPEVKPGMWEYQMEMKIPGMQVNMPAQVVKRCLTADDVAKNKQYGGNEGGKNPCTITNMKNVGGKVSYDFSCKSERGTMSGSASGTASPTAIEMESRMTMNPPTNGMSEMQQKMRAKRIGEC